VFRLARSAFARPLAGVAADECAGLPRHRLRDHARHPRAVH